MSFCPQCRTNDGPHFVPPSVGDPGFYTCWTPAEIERHFAMYDAEVLRSYAPCSPRHAMALERTRARKAKL